MNQQISRKFDYNAPIENRVDPVSNYQHSAAGKFLTDGCLDEHVCFKIACSSRFIEKQDLKTPESPFKGKCVTLVFRSTALARHMSCLWPTLKFSPPSATTVSSPLGMDITDDLR